MSQLRHIFTALLIAALFAGCASTPDKPPPPEESYAKGEEQFKKSNYERAIEEWKKTREAFPPPELAAKAEIGIANAYFLNKDYIEAGAEYESFRKLHPAHDMAQFALYRQGLSSYNLITGIDTDPTPTRNALTLFESFNKSYPRSEFAKKTQEMATDCRKKLAQYEIYVGRFYFRTDKNKAAIGRLEKVMVDYPEYTGHDETLFYLGKAYRDDKQLDKMKATMERLIREFPKSEYVEDATEILAKHK